MKASAELAIFLLILLVFTDTCQAQINSTECKEKHKCNTDEKPVYGFDGWNCQIFRNKCLMELENCIRRSMKETELKKTPKEKCVPYCRRFCVNVYLPVCGIYRGGKSEFLNACYMNRRNCQSGERYRYKV